MATRNTAPPVRGWRRRGTTVIKAVTASGNTELVAAPSDGTKVRILRLYFSTDTAVNVKINEGASTALTLTVHLAANGFWSFDESAFIEASAADTAVNINLSGGITSGSVQCDYELLD